MNIEEQLKILQHRADLVKTDVYIEISSIQLNRILELASSGIDDKEIRGMLKLLKWTNDFPIECEEFLKREKEKINGR